MPTVLIVAASPLDQDRLSLNREVKKIKQSLERSRNRENWRIESNEAATVEDLRRALLDHQPIVVHFCGHGGGDGGLCFEDDRGCTHATHAAPLTKLFHLFRDRLKCVVLNACYSEVQASVIREQIDYVVGMRKAIGDEAAVRFAVAFYDAVFAGTDFRTAFDLGCTTIDLHNLPDTHVPVFLTSPHLGGTSLAYTENTSEIEDILRAYLSTPYSERYRLTTKGDRLLEAMKQFYGDRMIVAPSKIMVVGKQQIDALHWKIQACAEVYGQRAYRNYYLRIQERSIQIEWEATVGFWSMPVKTYLALGTQEDIVARVTAEIGDRYFGPFSDKQRLFQNVRLQASDGTSLYGYARRGTAVYEQLMGVIADGNPHDVTLAICNVDDPQYPVISGFLSRTWIMPDQE